MTRILKSINYCIGWVFTQVVFAVMFLVTWRKKK